MSMSVSFTLNRAASCSLGAYTHTNKHMHTYIHTVSHHKPHQLGRPRLPYASAMPAFVRFYNCNSVTASCHCHATAIVARCCAFCCQRQFFCCYYCCCWLAFVTVRRNIVGVGSHIFALVAAVFLHRQSPRHSQQ